MFCLPFQDTYSLSIILRSQILNFQGLIALATVLLLVVFDLFTFKDELFEPGESWFSDVLQSQSYHIPLGLLLGYSFQCYPN